MTDERHQGWTNYATFSVALHIDNTYELHKKALGITRTWLDHPKTLSECFAETFGPGYKVNWLEIAEHYRRKVLEGVT